MLRTSKILIFLETEISLLRKYAKEIIIVYTGLYVRNGH